MRGGVRDMSWRMGHDGSARKLLFIVAHPYLGESRANRAIVDEIRKRPEFTVHNLYDLYPYFHIDVPREQNLLREHRGLVVQHPLYWYSMPPLMKLWLDEVLEAGWAYGKGGAALKGKDFLLSTTVGGPRESYSASGQNGYAIETLLTPWEQTIKLCQMSWHEPAVLYDSIRATDPQLREYAHGLLKRLMPMCGADA